LSSKYQQKKKINAIDVDIYVNKADGKHLEEAVDLVQKLRMTAQAGKILDSTHHAIVRLALSNSELLISILNNRLDHGIIPDSYTINLALDEFLKNKDFTSAARIATVQTLQEDFQHPVTRYMALFACYKFLENLQTFPDLIPPPPPVVEETTTPKSKKKLEEKKVRVEFLRNPYFDDHFDLANTNHLLGKSFIYLADEVRAADATLADSMSLLGYALYEKYEDGNKFLESSQKLSFYKEVVDKIKSLGAENLDEHGQKFMDSIAQIASQKEGKVDELIEGHLKKAVSENESKDIAAQKMVCMHASS
jgi:small subunit ribosomal protein S27